MTKVNLSVECYDPTEDKWIEKTTIPVNLISEDDEYGDTFTELCTETLQRST